MLLSMLLTVAVSVALFGVGLRRMLGWPTDLNRLGRWGLALLIATAVLTAAPELVHDLGHVVPPLPSTDPVVLICALSVVGLNVLGYVAWVNGAAARDAARADEARTFNDERRLARPPAPEPSRAMAPEHVDGGTFRRREQRGPEAS